MYTKTQLIEDLKQLEKFNQIVTQNLISIKSYFNKKELDNNFYWTANSTHLMLENYKELSKSIKVQELYTQGMDTQTEELISRLKKVSAENYKHSEAYESILTTLIKYMDIAYMITSTLEALDNILESSEALKNEIMRATSNFIITKNIKLPEEDEDFEYVDIMINLMINIDNNSLQIYLQDLDNKIIETETQGEEEIPSTYTESGFEDFTSVHVKKEEDYEDLEDMLRNMKKNQKGF